MAVEVRHDREVQQRYDTGNDTEDQNRAFWYILSHQGQSVEWAMKYAGWAIVPVDDSEAGTEYAATLVQQPGDDGDPRWAVGVVATGQAGTYVLAPVATVVRPGDHRQLHAAQERTERVLGPQGWEVTGPWTQTADGALAPVQRVPRYLCKRCGAESPRGIGYVANGQTVFPAPDPACANPHVVRAT